MLLLVFLFLFVVVIVVVVIVGVDVVSWKQTLILVVPDELLISS